MLTNPCIYTVSRYGRDESWKARWTQYKIQDGHQWLFWAKNCYSNIQFVNVMTTKILVGLFSYLAISLIWVRGRLKQDGPSWKIKDGMQLPAVLNKQLKMLGPREFKKNILSDHSPLVNWKVKSKFIIVLMGKNRRQGDIVSLKKLNIKLCVNFCIQLSTLKTLKSPIQYHQPLNG